VTLVEVAADLRVRDGAASRLLSVTDWQAAATGAATQETLVAVLAELGQKLEPADVAALATAARQDAAQTVLSALLAALQGTLAVSGTVAVSNAPASPETGLAKDATLTARLPAALDADGGVKAHVQNFPATQPISGTVMVENPTANPETGLAKVTDIQAVRDRLPAALESDGALKVADVFTGGEALPDQTGDGTVKTFTFASPVDLVWVRSAVAARADPFGGTPTATTGIPCAADEPNPMSVRASSVKVFAASGTVSVWGYR